MRSGLVQLGAWAAATGAAVVLSWLGVHAVLVDTVFEQPVAVPLPSPTARASGPTDPPFTEASAQTGPAAATTAPATAPATGSPAASPSGQPPSPTRTGIRTASPDSSVHSYLVTGGRVALDLKPAGADLVSATPDSGWQMQIWHGDQWMRIDFSRDGRTSSVFVTWNGHPPDVQLVPAAE